MKTAIKVFLTFLGTFFLIYLLGCFSQFNFDITTWNANTRNVVATAGGIISLIACLIATDKI